MEDKSLDEVKIIAEQMIGGMTSFMLSAIIVINLGIVLQNAVVMVLKKVPTC